MKGKTLKKLCGSLIAVTVFITGLVLAPVNVMAEEEEGECTHEIGHWVEEDGMHYWRCLHCGEDVSDSKHRNHAIIRCWYEKDGMHYWGCSPCEEEMSDDEHITHAISLIKEEANHAFICYTYICGRCGTGAYGIYHVSTSENPTKCVNCGKTCSADCVKNDKDADKKLQEVIKEAEKKDPSREAFGGRAPEQLTLAEQKTSVSYALNALRASGNALPFNTVKTSTSNGDGYGDVVAVVADDRDAANQQAFAQAMCKNLGYGNVETLKTYNMYALYVSYVTKNKSQIITWSGTGLKFGDTAFVVWYNQKLGKMELLPAVVGADGTVAVSVPALGDCSTMTVVKANK